MLTLKVALRQCAGVYPRRFAVAAALIQSLLSLHCAAAPGPNATNSIVLKDVLVARSVARQGRTLVHHDPIEARLVSGEWRAPKVGEAIGDGGESDRHWEAASANEDGVLKGSVVRGGYVFWPVVSDRDQVMLLEASGDNCVYVNGTIRGGDFYGNGYLSLPVSLHAGTNEFLFQCGRGDLRAKLVPPAGSLVIRTADSTLPDVILGETDPLWGAAILVNATTRPMRAALRVLKEKSPAQTVSIPPLGIRKAPFVFKPGKSLPGTNGLRIELEAADLSNPGEPPAHAEMHLRIRRSNETYMRTFVSQIDDSVQYYAVNPPNVPTPGTRPALFLSLHGASVEARGQAEAYSPKKWGPIVCPTNRRPYGFDWEDWGRWDAMEVLQLAKARYQPDPQRIYLTGHSMGGHGTWQLGALFPDQFAAIGPSAGWISFTTYTNPNRPAATNTIDRMLRRANSAGETLLMATNYLQEGVYILHGTADDNVPISEAREMRRVLSGFHRDYDFHEQPGAGHWWDASDEPGADCVDWAPMFDFFAHHIIPTDESLRRIRFTTVNPAVSSKSHWVQILAQEHPLEPSSVDLRCDPGRRRIVGVTTNVSRLRLEFPSIAPGPDAVIELDGQKLASVILVADHGQGTARSSTGSSVPLLYLARQDGKWDLSAAPAVSEKRPERTGPFREAFRDHVAFVYGTSGTPEENAWSLAKARYDAETFYYRGNASVEIVSDQEAIAQDKAARRGGQPRPASRSLILYGSADCNAAWPYLLEQSPVQVRRGSVRIGNREFTGGAYGCLFLQPNPRDPHALVGVVAGSGLPGMRVTERLPYFLSGAGFPDCLVISSDLPMKGLEGVHAAGFFGPNWQVDTGEFAWSAAGQ